VFDEDNNRLHTTYYDELQLALLVSLCYLLARVTCYSVLTGTRCWLLC
jgi:hypothetical protein